MSKTNLELAHETAALIGCIEDNFSLFDGMNIDKSQLIKESLATIQRNISQLNSIYNSPLVEMKSVVELAEERHRMTKEEFEKLHFIDTVDYDGKISKIIGIDKTNGLIFLSNGIDWQKFDTCKLINT